MTETSRFLEIQKFCYERNGTKQGETVGLEKRLDLWIVVSGAVFFFFGLSVVFEIV